MHWVFRHECYEQGKPEDRIFAKRGDARSVDHARLVVAAVLWPGTGSTGKPPRNFSNALFSCVPGFYDRQQHFSD
jgi:hypothetical protein